VRRRILGFVLAVTMAGCTWQPELATSAPDPPSIEIVSTPQQYDRVRAGRVEALVPPGWDATATDAADHSSQGFVATPRLRAWAELRRGATGLSATWIDATLVGVPSDYYYLAATGPVLSRLMGSERCERIEERVFVNNAPVFAAGARRSPGDFVARGTGVCRTDGDPTTRWAYFVAAPGLGPAGEIGIPTSGLYLVVALAPAGPDAAELLDHLLDHTRFGDASVSDFIRAVRPLRVD
jgi:hypothetical protein